MGCPDAALVHRWQRMMHKPAMHLGKVYDNLLEV
jgi:hypothetical protein